MIKAWLMVVINHVILVNKKKSQLTCDSRNIQLSGTLRQCHKFGDSRGSRPTQATLSNPPSDMNHACANDINLTNNARAQLPAFNFSFSVKTGVAHVFMREIFEVVETHRYIYIMMADGQQPRWSDARA